MTCTIYILTPILLFSECHPLVNHKAVLKCFSSHDCKSSLQRIRDGYYPNYDDMLDFLSGYIASSQEELNDNIIRLFKYKTSHSKI